MSAQSLIGYGILVVFGAMIWIASGYVVADVLIPWGNGFINTFHPMQDSYNTAETLLQIVVASPFFGLLLWGYDHLNNSNSGSGGDQ
jgi:hypothetical protein